jgi:hypothetical protein
MDIVCLCVGWYRLCGVSLHAIMLRDECLWKFLLPNSTLIFVWYTFIALVGLVMSV